MLNHIALQYPCKKDAETFFTKILGIKKEREFNVPIELANSIFSINKEVDVIVFGNEKIRFEIFIANEAKELSYEHICLEVENKKDFIKQSGKYGIEPIFIKKGDKILLFIRDFANYLYEIKEKSY